MKDPQDTVTISRKLAFRLLGKMEDLAENQLFEDRYSTKIVAEGDMPKCYYQLQAALSLSAPNEDLIDIERDNE
jgi:hypothetical protein